MRSLLITIWLAAFTVAYSQDAPYDMKKIHWGLTITEVSRLLPALTPQRDGNGNRMLLDKELLWNQIKFNSSFFFEPDGSLRSIQLHPRNTDGDHRGDADKIEKSLRALYGDPKESQRGQHGYRRLVWEDLTHVVILLFVPDVASLDLIYSKPKDKNRTKAEQGIPPNDR